MTDLAHLTRAFSHDPVRRQDRSPAGAVPAGTQVDLVLRAEAAVRGCVHEALLVVDDAQGGTVGSTPMEACAEGYRARVDTAGEPRVLFYWFVVRTDAGAIVHGARQDGLATAGSSRVCQMCRETHAFDVLGDDGDRIRCRDGADVAEWPGPIAAPFQLTAYDPAFTTPDWYAGSVMYQIFPDRFARGVEGIRRDGVESHVRRGWPVQLHEDWNGPPAWGDPYDPVDFFGGTFAGIEQRLDYLASLGVGTVYLNPICEARSNHRYDTGDYRQVDPILGTWEDFERLSEAAAKRGIRIVLDTVLSHTGAASRYFNLDGSYDSLGAAQGECSPYRSWYDFAHPTQYAPYRCWWNDPTLPEVEEHDPSWQAFVFGDGLLAEWVRHGAGGLRLDVADEIPDDVLEKVRQAVKAASPDAVVIGEVWEDPTTKESYGARRTYALGRSLDTVMNYPLRASLLRFALGHTDAPQLATFLKMQQSNYPAPLHRGLMNLLSSHDVERVRSVLDLGMEFRDRPRDEQAALVAGIDSEADARGALLQRLLACIIYMLPGVPCLYYGDERGMQGGRDPFDRATFPWDGERADCGRDVTGFYRALGKLRLRSEVLKRGSAAFYSYGKDVACVLRMAAEGVTLDGALLCVANRSDEQVDFVIDLVDASAGLSAVEARALRFDGAVPRCVLATDESGDLPAWKATLEDGIFRSTVGPRQACVFQLDAGLQKPLGKGLGVICHITSVPNEDAVGGRVGPGTLGAPAKRFVDVLAKHGVRYWQILPLNPTDEYGSPYAGLSAFAGNTRLLEAGTVLDDAVADTAACRAFVEANRAWLVPYATFVAIKRETGGALWRDWPERYRRWTPALANDPALADGIRAECVRQFAFDQQWRDLRVYASQRGVSIVGDLPMYVSADSADAWVHPEYLALDAEGRLTSQGGVPPDQFSAEGQLWGNPTYDWDALAANGYDWWLARFQRAFEWYDFVRIDHFLGFESYYAVPAGAQATEGAWLPGPGIELFRAAYERFGPLPVIAEDLGIVTPQVQQLLAETGFTGMDVVQFFDGDPVQWWQPQPGKACFTSTHDTQTLLGWVKRRYGLGGAGEDGAREARRIADELMARVTSSDVGVAFVSLQDVLHLDDAARMNVPGTAEGNWAWQATQRDLDRWE